MNQSEFPFRNGRSLQIRLLHTGPASGGFIQRIISASRSLDCQVASANAGGFDATPTGFEIAVGDAAIALVTNEQSSLIESHRLWGEIGFWLGSRDRRLIGIIQQDGAQLSQVFGQVSIERFSSESDVILALSRQVDRLRTYFFPSRPDSPDRKIGAVFRNPRGQQSLSTKTYLCHRLERDEIGCEFRKTSLALLAEFLRMGRATHERNTIEDCLLLLAYHAHKLLSDRSRRSGSRDADDSLRAIITVGDHIAKTFESLFPLPSRKGDDPPMIQRQRFVQLLSKKLTEAARCAGEFPLTASYTPTLLQRLNRQVPALWDWLVALTDPDYLRKLEEPKWKAIFSTRFRQLGDYCREIAMLLQALNLGYARACETPLSELNSTIDDPRFLHSNFRRAIDSLPHNRPEPLTAIWRSVN